MNNKDNISSLYKMLVSEGISEQELGGNEAGFRKALADPQRRKSGYDWLSQRVPVNKLGSYDYFNEGVNIALSESNPVSKVGVGIQASPAKSQRPMVLRPEAQTSATTKPNIATHTQGLAFGKEVPLGTEAVTPKFDRQADGTGKDKYIPQPTLVPSAEHPAMPKKVVKDYVHNKTYDWDSEQGQALVEKSSEVKNKYGDQLEKVGIGQFNIGERLENARKALSERGKQVREEYGNKWWQNINRGGGIAGMPHSVATNNGLRTDSEYISLQGAIRALENSQELLNEQYKSQREKGITGFAKGAGRGIKNKLFDVRTWDGGVQDMIEGGALTVALDKHEKGEKLSEAEQALLDAKATEVAVRAYTANDIGYGYEAGEVTAQALPFMLEMLINPASKAGTSIGSRVTRYALNRFAQKGLSEGAKKLATKAVGVASRVAGDAVGATGMAMTTGLGRVGADATRRMAGDIQHGHNEEGNTVFTGVENREEATDAVLKALGSTAIENHSEMVGEYFAPIGKALGRVFSKGASKVGLGSVSDAINAVANSPWAKKMKSFTDKTQWNGIVGEFSEEIAGGIENALIVGDQTLDTDPETGVFNSENLLRTAVGVGLMGGFMSAVRTAGYRTEAYRTEAYEARKYMERSGRDAERLFEDKKQWEEIRQQIDKDDYAILYDPNLSHEERMIAIRYTVSRSLYQGVQGANNKVAPQGNATASELSPILHQGENKVILAKRAGVEGSQAIINGNVVRREDGTIDRDASSKSIVVYNPESGDREMIDIDTLEGVEEEMSLEEWEARQSNPMPSEGYTPTDSVIPTPNAELEQSVQSEGTTPAPEQEAAEQGDGYMFEPGDMFELELPGVGRIAGSAFGFDADGRLQIHTQEAVQLPGEKRPLMYHAVDAEQLRPLIASYTASERIDDEEAYSPYIEDTAPSTEDWQEDEMYEPAYEENVWEYTSEEAPQEVYSEDYTPSNDEQAPNRVIGRSMTENEASTFIASMEANAEPTRELDLTIENWDAEFGESGEVDTPIGKVKMGESQFVKMHRLGRSGKLGLVKPTLTNPDVIIEDYREAQDGISERPTSYVFVKSFMGKNNERHYFFTSVTVSKDGREVVISNEERRANRISKLLGSGKVVWIKDSTSSHPYTQVEESVPLSDSNKFTDTDNQSAWHGIHSPSTDTSKGSENKFVSKWQAILAEAEGDREMAEDVANSMLEDLKVDLKNHISKGKKAKGKTTSEKFAYLKEHKAKRAELEAEIAEWENAIKEAKQSQLQSFAEEVEARGEQPSTLEEAKKQEEELRQARIQAEEDARLQREQYGEIPEWGEDKPSDARARGYRKYQNEIYERSNEIPAIKGADTRVKFHDEHQPEGRYTLVEASDIQPSHYEGKANPRFFLDEAQPKDRVDADSVHKARVMAEQMNPEEITSGATAYVGTPVVNTRGEVLQGNGRTAGLRYMYEQSGASADGYRKYLSDNASRWGFSSEQVEGMRQPVLVRMTDVSDSRAIELGQYRSEDTESGGEQRIRPIETMRKLGDRMQEFTSRLLGSSDNDATLSDLIRENGGDTLSWLLRMNIITAPQLQASVSKDGKVNKVGVEALVGILEESLFTNAPEQLRKDFETLPSNAQQALLATAYRDLDSSLDARMMSELQASIQVYAIIQASGTFNNVRSTEEAIASVRQWLLQSEDFMDGVGALTPEERYGFSNFALHLASLYHKGKKSELTQLFNNLYDEVQGKAEDIFDPDRGVVKSLSEAIKRILNIDYNGQIRSETVAKPHQPSPSGERAINSDDTSGGSTERESRGDTAGGSDKTSTRPLETDIKPIGVGSFDNIHSQKKEASAPTSSRTDVASTQEELLDDTTTQQKVDASESKGYEKRTSGGYTREDIKAKADAIARQIEAIERGEYFPEGADDLRAAWEQYQDAKAREELGSISRSEFFEIEWHWSIVSDKYLRPLRATLSNLSLPLFDDYASWREQHGAELAESPQKGAGVDGTVWGMVGQDSKRPILHGVHYQDGYAVGSDGAILLGDKTAYDKSHEGKTVAPKTGAYIDGKYPDWKAVIPDGSATTAAIDSSKLSGQLRTARAAALSLYKGVKPASKRAELVGMSPVGLLLSDGRIVYYPLQSLERLSSSGERLSFDSISVYGDGRLLSKSEQGLFISMPIDPSTVTGAIVGYVDLSGGAHREFQIEQSERSRTESEASKLATDAVLLALENSGIDVVRATDVEVEAVLGRRSASVELSREQKRALDTAEQSRKTTEPTVVSSADGAKVLRNLDEVNRQRPELHMVWHGSPHSFATFDHSHMGSGEGTQAFGWGTYVTEVEGIARSYASMQAGIEFNGYPIMDVLSNGNYWDPIFSNFLSGRERSIEELKSKIKSSYIDGRFAGPRSKRVKEFIRQKDKLLEAITRGEVAFSQGRSHLYTVEIPDNTGRNYLNWDKRPTKTIVEKVLKHLTQNYPDLKAHIQGSNLYWELEGSTYSGSIESGEQLYNTIASIFGHGEMEASLLLSDIGLKGILYPANYLSGGRSDGARNYVIFREKDAKIVEHVQFMRTPQGVVYGWTEGGKIYLTEAGMQAETPIHEYTHIWVHAMQRSNPEGWQSIKDLLRGTPLWQEVLSDPNYQHIANNEDAIASEALSRFSGQKGRVKMEEIAQQTLDNARGAVDKIEAGSVLAKMREALNKFWRWVGKSLFDIKRFDSIEEVADRVLYDLVNGTELETKGHHSRAEMQVKRAGYTEEMERIKSEAEANGTFMLAPNGKSTNLNERQWLQVRTKAFKGWFGDWEKSSRIEKLRKAEPVVLTGNEYEGKYKLERKSAKEWVKSNLRGKYTIEDTQEVVTIGRKGVNKVTSHSAGSEAHLKSFVAIPEMLNKATFITEEQASKNNAQYPRYRYYLVGLRIDGTDYTAKLTIGVDENGNKYYDHALTEIEKVNLLDRINSQADRGFISTGAEPNLSVTGSKDSKLLLILQTDASKVVDENGEPLVVYHGTNAKFNTFSLKKTNTPMFYFTSNREKIEQGSVGARGSGRIIEAYLNLQKPAGWNEDDRFTTDQLKHRGYDGKMLLDDGYNVYVTFSPEQIKSATDNVGMFDGGNADIRYRRGNKEEERSHIDEEYLSAIERGDMEEAERLVHAYAKSMGYSPSEDYQDAHAAPVAQIDAEDFTNIEALEGLNDDGFDINLYAIAHGIQNVPDDYFSPSGARRYMYDTIEGRESYANLMGAIRSIRSQVREHGEVLNMPKVVVYRAVPNEVREGVLQSGGQWVSPSRSYAEAHGASRFGEGAFRIIEEEVSAENLWWDNNDINEWGFDDGKTYGYKNTKNSRKLYDVVTYDDQGRVIPLSHRFDEGKSDARYRRGQTSDRNGKDSPRAIAERAEGLGRELGVAVRIVSDKRTLPKRQQGVMGWFDPRSGEVVVVLENHRSVSDVEATVYHEVIGHKGLRELVGEEVFETFLHELYKSLPQDVQSRISMRFAGGGVRSLSESIEEYLAEFAERGFDKERSLWRKIVDKVRELVRNYIKPNLLVTENDIRYLLWKAYHLRKRSAKSQYSHIAEALALGEDIAKRNDLGITLQDRTLENINEQFNETLYSLTEENASSTILHLGIPSLILQSAGVSPKPMKLYGNKVIKKMKKHGFALGDLTDLPRAVANPVAVFNNIGREGNRSILTELRTTQGNILVTIDLGKGVTEVDFNIVSSVFGKSDGKIVEWINKGYATYINKRKTLNYLRIPAPIAGAQDSQGYSSATKIVESFENPSIELEDRYRRNEQSIKQAKAVDYLYLLESEGKYIETGQSRVDEDYDEGEAEREQRLVLRPKYEVREYTDEGYDAYIEEYEHIEDAEKALRDRHRPETDREYSEPYRELSVSFEPLWLNLNNEEVESDEILLYDEVEYEGYELPEALQDLNNGILGEYHFDSASDEKAQKESAIIEGLNSMLVEALSHVEEDLDGRPIRIDASQAFTRKYSSIEFYDKETDALVGRIQLRLSDHSYNPANNDESARDGNFISVVLTDNDPTYSKFSGRYNLYYNYENSTSDIVADVVDRVYSIINEWEFDDGRIRYRRGDTPNVEAQVGVPGSARAEYEYKVRHFGDENRKGEENYFGNFVERGIEGYVDYMRAPKIFMGAVLKEDGGELQEFEDFYTAENHLSSRNQGEASAYKRDHIDPLLEQIATIVSSGISYEDIKSYLIAKHGLERNEYMSRKTAKLEATQSGKTFDGEYTLEDYSGLVALTQSEEHFTELAEELVREFESKIGNDVVDELWNHIRSATRASLRKGVLSHIITKTQSEEWQSMYQYYVPLRGWAEERTAEEMWNYKKIGNSNSGNVLNKKTDGRKSLADDPIAQIAFMGEGVIRQGNRNLVKNMFLNFVLNHPTDLATVSRTWYVKQDDGSWLKEAPNFDDAQSEAERAEIANTFEERMKQLQKEKKARKRPPKGGEPIKVDARISPSELKQHAIHVMRGGEEYIIYINGNPRVAQAINGLLDEVDNDNWFSKANNYFAQTLTSKSPTFILKNGVMDTIGATVALSIKEDASYVKNFASLVKNPIQTAQLIRKFNAGTLDMDNELERYFDEFIRYGGETGHTQIHSVRDYKNDIERFLKRQTPAENIRQALGRPTATALRWVGDGIEFANRTAEVNTRFATYVASRKAGRSVQRSVHDAKEVTVNFNRKGTGGMGAKLLRYAYIFLNASIQSMRQLKELRDANPKRFYAFVTGITTLGVALPLTNLFLMALLSDDDDIEEKYWAMNEYTRRSNLLFYVGNGNFVKIPLPPQFRPLYGAGENIFSFAMGRQNFGATLMKITGGFGDLSPVDPIGGNGGNVLINLLPSHSQTIAQLTHNVNYFGQPIWRETDYNSEMPEWTKAKDANPYLVDFTKFLNALSGGDDYTSGKIDFNPEVIEHLIEGYTGGTGRFVNQVVRTTMMPFDEDQRDLRNLPFAGTFLGTSPYGEAGRLSSQYWELRAQFEEIERIEREYKKAIKNGDKEERATFKEHLRTLRNSPEYQVYRQKTRNVDTIYQLYKKRKKTEDPQKQDSIAKKMQDLERKTVEGGVRLDPYAEALKRSLGLAD